MHPTPLFSHFFYFMFPQVNNSHSYLVFTDQVVRVPGSIPLLCPRTDACEFRCVQCYPREKKEWWFIDPELHWLWLNAWKLIRYLAQNYTGGVFLTCKRSCSRHLRVREDLPPWQGFYWSVRFNLKKENCEENKLQATLVPVWNYHRLADGCEV